MVLMDERTRLRNGTVARIVAASDGKKLDDDTKRKCVEALKKAAKASGKPCPAEALRRAPKGARAGFTLDMGAVCDKKVHLLKPEPYVFRPLEKAYLK